MTEKKTVVHGHWHVNLEIAGATVHKGASTLGVRYHLFLPRGKVCVSTSVMPIYTLRKKGGGSGKFSKIKTTIKACMALHVRSW